MIPNSARLRRGIIALGLGLVLSLFPLGAQQLAVVVRDFEALDGVTSQDAAQISAVIRSGLANTDAFKVIESSKDGAALEDSGRVDGPSGAIKSEPAALSPLYAVDGSLSSDGKTLIVYAKIISLGNSAIEHVLLMELPREPANRLFDGIRAIGQDLANELTTLSLGATKENIKALLALGLHDDARRRCLVLLARDQADGELSAMLERAETGLADDTIARQRASLAQARRGKKADRDFMEDCLESTREALVMYPDVEAYRKNRERAADFLERQVLPEWQRARRDYYRQNLRRAEELIKGNRLIEAQDCLRQYLETEGSELVDRRFLSLSRRLRAELVLDYRAQARLSAKRGEAGVSLRFGELAIDQDPLDARAYGIYEAQAKEEALAFFDREINAATVRLGYRDRPRDQFGPLCDFLTYRGGTEALPLRGSLPAFGYEYGRSVCVSAALGLRYGLMGECFMLGGPLEIDTISASDIRGGGLHARAAIFVNSTTFCPGVGIGAYAKALSLDSTVSENGIETSSSSLKYGLGLEAFAQCDVWLNRHARLNLGLGLAVEYLVGGGFAVPGFLSLGMGFGD